MWPHEINFCYQYRWVYAFIISLIIVTISYYYDLKPIANEIEVLHLSEKKLLSQLNVTTLIYENNRSNPNLRAYKSHYSRSEFIMDLSASILQTGLIIHQLELGLSGSHSLHAAKMHLMVEGEFRQFMAFLARIKGQFMLLSNFSCELINENKLLFSLDIFPLGNIAFPYQYANQLGLSFTVKQNPFCLYKYPYLNIKQNAGMNLLSTPIALTKMIGYLEYGKDRKALIRLPDGGLYTSKLDSLFGNEHGKVIDIKKDYLLISLANKKLVTLKRERDE